MVNPLTPPGSNEIYTFGCATRKPKERHTGEFGHSGIAGFQAVQPERMIYKLIRSFVPSENFRDENAETGKAAFCFPKSRIRRLRAGIVIIIKLRRPGRSQQLLPSLNPTATCWPLTDCFGPYAALRLPGLARLGSSGGHDAAGVRRLDRRLSPPLLSASGLCLQL